MPDKKKLLGEELSDEQLNEVAGGRIVTNAKKVTPASAKKILNSSNDILSANDTMSANDILSANDTLSVSETNKIKIKSDTEKMLNFNSNE